MASETCSAEPQKECGVRQRVIQVISLVAAALMGVLLARLGLSG